MKSNIFFTALLFIILIDKSGLSQSKNKIYNIAGYDVEVVGDLKGFSLQVNNRVIERGVEVATFTLQHDQEDVPPKFSLKWALPSSDVAGYWSTGSLLDKTIRPNWGPSTVISMLARNAPIISLYSHNNTNRLNFSVSEALNTVILSTAIKEEDGFVHNEITFFSEKHRKLHTYQVEIRFDKRPVSFSKSLRGVADWWASQKLYEPSVVPEYAKRPMYSSWYSYHQNVTKDALLEECKLAKEMGFETIIVDDGWQTLDNNRGYAYTGDWKPERIPEMRAFVDAVHALKMKFLLWYAVPLVGEKSEAFKKMQGKFLRYWNGQQAYELDPRYPETRKFVIDTYKKAVVDWNLDGFKLDFVGRFKANAKTELVAENGRDYASVNEATDRLMTDLITALKEIKSDIMIEFRQPYIGPAMRKYGNIFRAADCPNLALVNRVRTTDLRLLSGQTAVHSDMLMWHYDEPVEIAALQMLNVIFSVPQISVRLADIPKDHFDMIRFYTKYWIDNRSILLDGVFEASFPLANYSILSASNPEKHITTLYSTSSFLLDSDMPDKVDIINAKKSSEIIIISNEVVRTYNYKIKNCLGKIESSGQIEFKDGANLLEVPVSGMVSLEKLN